MRWPLHAIVPLAPPSPAPIVALGAEATPTVPRDGDAERRAGDAEEPTGFPDAIDGLPMRCAAMRDGAPSR